jgi:hypothetical protein
MFYLLEILKSFTIDENPFKIKKDFVEIAAEKLKKNQILRQFSPVLNDFKFND